MTAKDLEVWLQQQVNEMWGRVGTVTQEVDANGDALDALNAASAAAKGNPPDPNAVADQLQNALNALPDTPENQERREMIQSQLDQIRPSDPAKQKAKQEAAMAAFYGSRQNKDTDMNVDAFRKNLEATGLFSKTEIDQLCQRAKETNGLSDGSGSGEEDVNALENMMGGFIKDTMFPDNGRFDKDRAETTIGNLTKGIESDNELKMIYLQQAMSDAQESIQLVSNIHKNNSETNKAVIANLL